MLKGAVSNYPLVSKFAITIICGSLNREGQGAEDQGPFNTDFIHQRTTHQANCVIDSVVSIRKKMAMEYFRSIHVPIAIKAYLIAVDILDTFGVARPPPPRPESRELVEHISRKKPC
jgi:hypothetical protein